MTAHGHWQNLGGGSTIVAMLHFEDLIRSYLSGQFTAMHRSHHGCLVSYRARSPTEYDPSIQPPKVNRKKTDER